MPITKMHFQHAAEMVAAIKLGTWTHTFPLWASEAFNMTPIEVSTEEDGNLSTDYTRAVWTAEAFILLFSHFNPRFDSKRFLKACGFTEPA